MTWVIGIDLGGSKIALGLVSPENEIVSRRRINTDAEEGVGSVTERIAAQVDSLKSELPAGEALAGVGIGTPGPVDHVSGDLHTLVNLPRHFQYAIPAHPTGQARLACQARS